MGDQGFPSQAGLPSPRPTGDGQDVADQSPGVVHGAERGERPVGAHQDQPRAAVLDAGECGLGFRVKGLGFNPSDYGLGTHGF